MKTNLISGTIMCILSFALILLFSFTGKNSLIGRWATKPSIKGNVTSIVFKSDNSFEGFINKKPFVTGTYILEDSIFSFVDNGCHGIKGVYKIIFFSNADSVRFEPVNDSCTERKNGMSRLIAGRVRK